MQVVLPPTDAVDRPSTEQSLAEAGGFTPVGKTIGRYHVGYELASGGMATVYLASLRGAAGFEKVLALKCIHPHLSKDPHFVDMFLDEARIASKVNHPNVVQIFDFGTVEDAHYLAMEYLIGETLARILDRLTANPPLVLESAHRAMVLRVLVDACEGVHAVHEARGPDGELLGVVHRDITPQNLFLTFDGAAKILDFGIARARDQLHRTETGEIKGNFPYVSPEQIKGRDVDRRADVWSLGVILWECLTGDRLFRRTSSAETVYSVVNDVIRRADAIQPGVPRALADVAARALERDRESRFATARELGRAIEEASRDVLMWPSQSETAEWIVSLFPGAHAQRLEEIRATQSIADAPITRVERKKSAKGLLFPILIAVIAATAGAAGAILLTQEDPVADATGGAEVPDPAPEAPPPTSDEGEDEPGGAEVPDPAPEAPPGAHEPTSQSDVGEASGHTREARVTATGAGAAEPREAPVTRMRRAQMAAPPAMTTPAGNGRISVVTPDGWAEVYLGSRRLGVTPLSAELPAGNHTLTLRPFGRRPYRRVQLRVVADDLVRRSVRVNR